jgi:hypothetical protein
MTFKELEIGQLLLQEMENKHFALVLKRNRDVVEYLQISISERDFRYGYRVNSRKVWNNPSNPLSSYELVSSFSGSSREIIKALLDGRRVKMLPRSEDF